MQIKIAQRLSPFSHVPGAGCLVPGTFWELEAFPTLLRFGKKIDVKLQLTGPVSEFTLQQDLEKNCVWVFGKAQEGYYRLKVEANDEGFILHADRVPEKGLTTSHGVLHKKQNILIRAEFPFSLRTAKERLSLGSHKNQDWDGVQKRCDLREILPTLFMLGQKLPPIPMQKMLGTAKLLELPKDRALATFSLENFFKAAFTKILVPRLKDDQYQGIAPDEPVDGNPAFLVQEGAKMVRGLFFKQNERRLEFLPFLPIPFDCGRLIQLQVQGVGEIDLEWSKKLLTTVIIRATTPGEVVLVLQKELKSLRVRTRLKEKGHRQKGDEPLLLKAGHTYYLDRFQK